MTGTFTLGSLPSSSLVICSRNRPGLLLETVDSVLRGQQLPRELIIVDQSEHRHARLASLKSRGDCEIRYVWTHSVGASRARNLGAIKASYPVLVFLDDDMYVTPEWYGVIIRAVVTGGPTAIITGRVLPSSHENPGGIVPTLVEGTQARTYTGRIGTDVLPSCHMALYRAAFEAIGGFDERLGPGTRFPSAEDNDFGYRALELGYRIIFAPEAVVFHRAWRGTEAFFPLRWTYGRAQGGFYGKHFGVRDLYIAHRMAADIGVRVVRFPWRFLHRPKLAVGDLVFVLGVLSGCCEWRLARPRRARADPLLSGA
jgi:GT2 family glycosyltransferase